MCTSHVVSIRLKVKVQNIEKYEGEHKIVS